jgi:N6-L-threonylcarbamoyladenine synthase
MAIILGIESSCDDTAASVICDGKILSNVIASQSIHMMYGGVVPELASRAHQQNIVPVVSEALKKAKVNKNDLNAIAFTRGPGLIGSLLVGTSFAKGLAQSLAIPLIDVNHLQAHVFIPFVDDKNFSYNRPSFPFLSLLVSGGNSQLILVKSYYQMEIIGQTIDDAAGEAFDKCAKIMGLPYPGGPFVDKLAQNGNPNAFIFNKPKLTNYDYSFSGLKTSFLYLVRDNMKDNPNFIEENKADLCASLQKTIVEILLAKLQKAAKDFEIKTISLSGGVSANSALRKTLNESALKNKWEIHIPELSYTTDNAAMIALIGYNKYLDGIFCQLSKAPFARVSLTE